MRWASEGTRTANLCTTSQPIAIRPLAVQNVLINWRQRLAVWSRMLADTSDPGRVIGIDVSRIPARVHGGRRMARMLRRRCSS